MDVTLATGLLTCTLVDGTSQVYSLNNTVDAGSLRWRQYNTVPPVLTSDPFTQPTPTSIPRYKVILHFNDNRWLELRMGTIGNQPTWTDNLVGAAQAILDIAAVIPT